MTGFLLRLLRFATAWFFTGLFWTVFLSLFLLSLKQLPGTFVAKAIRFWGNGTLAILGIQVHTVGRSTLDTPASRVVVTNHQSALDLVWGATICPPSPLVIGKKEVIFIPVLNAIFWGMDFIRIDRKNSARAIAALKGVAEQIRSGGRSLVMAPEGTRSPDGKMLPFKKGAFHLAIEAQVPVFPVVVHGAYELCSKHVLVPHPGHFYLQFLDPVPTQGLTLAALDSLITEVRTRMEQAYEKLRKDYPNVRS